MGDRKQYWHTMSWTSKGSAPTVDPVTGFPEPGSIGVTVTAQCRYENFGMTNRREWTGEDGKTILQRGTIYVLDDEPLPEKFERVQVVDPKHGDIIVFEGPVLNIHRGKFNSTIAV